MVAEMLDLPRRTHHRIRHLAAWLVGPPFYSRRGFWRVLTIPSRTQKREFKWLLLAYLGRYFCGLAAGCAGGCTQGAKQDRLGHICRANACRLTPLISPSAVRAGGVQSATSLTPMHIDIFLRRARPNRTGLAGMLMRRFAASLSGPQNAVRP